MNRKILPILLSFLGLAATTAPAAPTGEQIYTQHCARCHGPEGQGVPGNSEEPLTGSRSIASLTRIIEQTMPEDKPELVVGEDAKKVAEYIYSAFYSAEARSRLQPAKIDFSRLTVRQYQNSIADLIGSFRGEMPDEVETGGLKGQYYATRNFRGGNAVIERTDPGIDFVFENATPDAEKIKGEEFSIRWRGSVVALETGDYEFVIKTENGARLWVNDDDKALIDAWVTSGSEPREHRGMIHLLGGRAYPIRLDVFRMKDKTASISLQWRPPHGPKQPIPPRHLSPTTVPETMVVTTPFPADDGSLGYERGTSISKQWHDATTSAAIEVAVKVVAQLDDLTRAQANSSDREAKVKAFLATLAERAFRRPLSDAEKAFFADAPFRDAKDLESGVKRAVILILKSPRFLYPELPDLTGQYLVASRLALNLWDSLPDRALLEAAENGKLQTPQQVAEQARRMLKDVRARSKVRVFLHHWLEVGRAESMAKDPKLFPDFNDELLADLRTSLDLFLDSIVWSEKADYRQLLLADYLFMNPRLAEFYDVELPETPESPAGFVQVTFDPKKRTGVLTHPFLLATLAYHNNTSPIHRGVFLTRNVVGMILKPPPAATAFMDDKFDPTLTMREKVAELTRTAACQGCHQFINPLGFSLEHYDAVGRFRMMDNRKPVDSASDFPTNEGKNLRVTGPRDVAQYAAQSPDAHRAFIHQLFNHTVKQPAEAYGRRTTETLRAAFAKNEFNIQHLLVDISTLAALHGGQAIARSTP